MKRELLLAVVIMACCTVLGSVHGQEAKPSAGGRFDLAKPGAEHQKLAEYAGDWSVEVRMGSGNSALTYTGAAKNRMIVGGRFLEIEYEAQAKDNKTEGVFLVAFDGRHQRFALVSLDNFGTYFVTSQGKRDENGKAKLIGSDDDPQMKAMGYTKEFAHVLDLRSKDEFVIEVWFVDTRTPSRREFKYMDYTFKRGK